MTVETKKYVWLDVDPGHDDAMLLLMAGNYDRANLELIGVSTIAGNQTAAKTTQNALKMMTICGMENIPVVRGAAKPLLGPERTCAEIHGETGLDGPAFPHVSMKPVDENAIVYMYNRIKSCATTTGCKVHIVATAAQTNVALLLSVFPDVKDYIAQIVIMGGAIGIGNMDPAGEWNILLDPEAARIVFESGLKVVMVPLEVTHTALLTKDILAQIRAFDTPFTRFLEELMMFFASTYDTVFQMPDPPLHDPCALAYVIAPEIFETMFINVEVETSGMCRGRTICDVYRMTKRQANVHVTMKMDVPKFWSMMLQSIRHADAVSCLNNK